MRIVRTKALGSTACLALALVGVALTILPTRSVAATQPSATATAAYPRVVNGHTTSSYPATGALLLYDDANAASLYGLCSGTLIGCRTFLSAAHCVCPDDTDDATACKREGIVSPATMRVFLPQGGMLRAASVAISPDYSFAERGDVAVITLAESVTGIAPSAINTTRRPDLGTPATIVGFGTTGGRRFSSNDAGIKREGTVATASSVPTTVFAGTGQLSNAVPEAQMEFVVPEGAATLRIALNGQLGSAAGFASGINDYDLYVRADAAPTVDAFDCIDANPTPFGFCEIAAPQPGTWHVLIRLNRGDGAYQLTATTFADAPQPLCTGDCNGDGVVTIDEVLTGINVSLAGTTFTGCPSFPESSEGVVTVDELIAAVTYALSECPAS